MCLFCLYVNQAGTFFDLLALIFCFQLILENWATSAEFGESLKCVSGCKASTGDVIAKCTSLQPITPRRCCEVQLLNLGSTVWSMGCFGEFVQIFWGVFKAVVRFLKAKQDFELKLLAVVITDFSVAFDIVIKKMLFPKSVQHRLNKSDNQLKTSDDSTKCFQLKCSWWWLAEIPPWMKLLSFPNNYEGNQQNLRDQ